MNKETENKIDKSDAADAKRMRWLLDGNGFFMEECGLCGCSPCSEERKDAARRVIDLAMQEENH